MLITRYLFRNLIYVTAFIAVTLTAVIWLTQSLRLLELIANSDAPASLFVRMIGLMLPKFLEIILPLSLVSAILFTYNKMIMDNELIVLRSCGFDQITLSRPALYIAGAMTAVLLLLSTWLSPVSYSQMQNMRQEIKAKYSAFLLREGVFNTFGKDLTVYLRRRESNGDLIGIMIHDTRDKDKPPVTITAKRGTIATEGDLPSILVSDGLRQQMDTDSGVISRLFFSRYKIEVKGLESTARTRNKEADERTIRELLDLDMNTQFGRLQRDGFLVELHRRIVSPFNALGFSVVALCALLLGPFNRRGQTRKIMLAVMLVLLVQGLNLWVVGMARKNIALVPLIYIVTFIPLFAGFYFLRLNGEQQLMRLMRAFRRGKTEQEVVA